jgi:hypothetical protein
LVREEIAIMTAHEHATTIAAIMATVRAWDPTGASPRLRAKMADVLSALYVAEAQAEDDAKEERVAAESSL